MSIKVMISIWYTEFTDLPTGELADDGRQKMAKASSCKSVLLAIADQGNDLGEGSFPGFTRLELKTGLSRQGIADVQKALKYNGLLSVADEKSKFNTNDYKINLECFPGGLDNIGEKLLVKPLDQSSHLTNVGQATLPEVVKPLDLKHTITVQQTNKPVLSIENAIATNQPVTPGMLKPEEHNAPREFERAFGFGELPWDSTQTWQKFKKFVVSVYQSTPRAFAEYVQWREGEGKYRAFSNKKIRETPAAFMDTGWPEFLVRHITTNNPYRREPKAL